MSHPEGVNADMIDKNPDKDDHNRGNQYTVIIRKLKIKYIYPSPMRASIITQI